MMIEPKLMIIHPDYITAKNIQNRLTNRGYHIAGTFFSLEEIEHRIDDMKPDLVLLDGHVKGTPDSLELASYIESCHHIPVILLIDKSMQPVIDDANFLCCSCPTNGDRELFLTIDLALSRHLLNHRLNEQEQMLNQIMINSSDAVITVNAAEHIVSMNPTAESITGWSCPDATLQRFSSVLKIVEPDDDNCEHFSQIFNSNTTETCIEVSDHVLITRNGHRVPVNFKVSPIGNGVKTKFLVILKPQN